jgi:GNAT superfamily N-acetyltransferase
MLRRATPSDVPDAMRIIAAALAERGLPFEPEGRDADVAFFGARPDHDDFVATIDDEVVGVVSVGPHGDPSIAWISKLFVSRAARRAGIGRALLSAAHDAARARGYRTVGLRSRRVFREALALYASEGYAPREAVDPALLEPGDVVLYRAL